MQCKTKEVEPGKFVRKCEKTEQLLRDCAGRSSDRETSTSSSKSSTGEVNALKEEVTTLKG
ncbi:unnamed protein product [Malus baccata var. baccata]